MFSTSIIYLGTRYARFSPGFYYWFFISCDTISLVLQAVGGALSSQASGGDKPAINTSIAGLSFQVFTLCVFIALSLEYAWNFVKSHDARIDKSQLPLSFKIFITFLSAAILLILIRCAYRIDELSNGWIGPLIHNQGLFIGLEGVYVKVSQLLNIILTLHFRMVIVAAFCLNVAHPGPSIGWPKNTEKLGGTNSRSEVKA